MNTYCITLLPDLTSTPAEFSQSSESRESSSPIPHFDLSLMAQEWQKLYEN